MATSSLELETERKKRRIRRKIKHLARGWVVLAEDETDLLLFPLTRAGWSLQDQEARIEISGTNAKRTLFGSINIRTGYRLFLVSPRQRSADFMAFLTLVRAHYRSQPIMMLLDSDSSHTAQASKRLARKLRIHLEWLPTRSPKLNPMDHLWRHGKRDISSLHQYKDIDEHVSFFLHYMERMSPQDALRKAGLLSKKNWLRP